MTSHEQFVNQYWNPRYGRMPDESTANERFYRVTKSAVTASIAVNRTVDNSTESAEPVESI